MTEKEIQLIDLIVNEMGETVSQVGEGNDSRYFLGTIETPNKEENYVVVVGKEVSQFFGASAMMKASDQIKMDIQTFTANIAPIVIKFGVNVDWFSYSKL